MDFFLFGCKDTSLSVAEFLHKKNIKIHLVTISKSTAKKNDVAGYMDLKVHRKLFASIYIADKYNLQSKNDKKYFEKMDACKIGFCVGWQRLIPSQILRKFSKGIHGMHGSARDLPFGKGRSPMNWSLIEGRRHFFTNLFKYSDGIDNGPVLDTLVFSIQSYDTAETMHYKNTLAMCNIIEKNLTSIIAGKIKYKPQNSKNGETFYSKRSPSDGIIDWRDDLLNIEKLIRAVSPPFHGAIAFYKGKKIRIFRAAIFYTDLENHPFINAKLGEILAIFPSQKFLIKCSGGVIIVHESSPIKLRVGSVLDQKETPFKNFKRNKYGFFDL